MEAYEKGQMGNWSYGLQKHTGTLHAPKEDMLADYNQNHPN
jgi:hypothetical protein